MKLAITAAACAVGLSAVVVAPGARAADFEMHHGSECKVFGSTASTDLAFSGYGVKNLQSTARQVICPITKDSETTWDGTFTAGANVRVYVEAGSVNAAVTCTAYVTSNNPSATTVNTYAFGFGQLAANSSSDGFLNQGLQMSSVAASSHFEDKIYILCTLGPQTRLKGYYSYEHAVTD